MKSKSFKDKVEFIKSKFEDTLPRPNSIDYAIAFSSFYHTDLYKSFKKLKTYLKDGKCILWDGSSHFYDDKEFPSNIYGFRYHKILGYILKEVSKKVKVMGDYKDLSRPKYSLGEIKQISLKEDFITEKIAVYLSPVDLQVFIKNFVPYIIRKLVSPEIEDREFNFILKESLGNVISNPKALEDNTHKYGIKAVFRSTKINFK